MLGWRPLFRRLWEAFKRLWLRAKSERASPREIFWAVSVGAFCGCTPAVGLRPWIAIAVATFLKKNRLFCYIGSHTSNILFTPFITLAEVQLAHRLRTGEWAILNRHNIVEQAPSLLVDWCLGTIPVGLVVGLACGLLGYALARRRDARRAARAELTPPPLAGAPPPSSG
ncbi:MAG: hypothetical protein JWP97_5115 [Labilithrix sp.]|nr:hypothetical protein [Labilithrix sp.]